MELDVDYSISRILGSSNGKLQTEKFKQLSSSVENKFMNWFSNLSQKASLAF